MTISEQTVLVKDFGVCDVWRKGENYCFTIASVGMTTMTLMATMPTGEQGEP